MEHIRPALDHVEAHRERVLDELKAFCRIPTISTLEEHEMDMMKGAEWLRSQLEGIGIMGPDIMDTGGHPVVYGEALSHKDKPTVLVYGHYDVQPVDPLDEWNTDPFDPSVAGDDLYARGASDMKAQIVACLKALEAFARTSQLPVNLKFLFEGEEEIGSPNLESFVQANRELLQCDVILNCDGGIHAQDAPSITYGLRGLAYFEVEVHGPSSDLHSGIYGGAVHNPLQALCELIAGMHDETGAVALPGFYDRVEQPSEDERKAIDAAGMSEARWKELTGAPAAWGEDPFSILERIGARPTLEINGIYGGFTGKGAKTVLPAKATAKISMRTVPDQRSDEVAEQLRAYLEQNAPETITWKMRQFTGAAPAVMDRNSPYMEQAAGALEKVFGKKPLFKRDGGTIPVVSILKQHLGVDTVLLGFELPDAGFHGPNEKMHIPTYYRGIETYIRFLNALGNGSNDR